MLTWMVKAGWILDFQYCKWLFFLFYLFNKCMFKAINLVFFFEPRNLRSTSH